MLVATAIVDPIGTAVLIIFGQKQTNRKAIYIDSISCCMNT